MKPIKQTVYLPVKVENIKSELKDGYDYIVKDETSNIHQHCWSDGEFYSPKGKKVLEVIQLQEGYFFTPEQLNEHIKSVIEQALETASERVDMDDVYYQSLQEGSLGGIDKQSILDTFAETFNQFKV